MKEGVATKGQSDLWKGGTTPDTEVRQDEKLHDDHTFANSVRAVAIEVAVYLMRRLLICHRLGLF